MGKSPKQQNHLTSFTNTDRLNKRHPLRKADNVRKKYLNRFYWLGHDGHTYEPEIT